jgi:ABC-type oligopeptide transport system substrate-binding subunit
MQSMDPRLLPPVLLPALRKNKDFGTSPALRTLWYALNVTKPPLDRLLVRYALNLSTDKDAIASFMGAGQKRANGIVPAMAGYRPMPALPVLIGGRELNVLAFDPRAARDLLHAEGVAKFELSLTIPTRPRSKEIAAIVQQHWREHVGIRLHVSHLEETVWEQSLENRQYPQVIEDSWTAIYDDPADYLVGFGPAHNSTWTDRKFDVGFTAANETADPVARMKALAACEADLMKAMPVVPLFHDTWAYLQAPFVRCLQTTPFGHSRFKYAWIDTSWRPS